MILDPGKDANGEIRLAAGQIWIHHETELSMLIWHEECECRRLRALTLACMPNRPHDYPRLGCIFTEDEIRGLMLAGGRGRLIAHSLNDLFERLPALLTCDDADIREAIKNFTEVGAK